MCDKCNEAMDYDMNRPNQKGMAYGCQGAVAAETYSNIIKEIGKLKWYFYESIKSGVLRYRRIKDRFVQKHKMG